MRQTTKIISTYTADTSGVSSALFELGGMVVMHDASGCNSTYNTHDEPRWYDMDSMVFISALSEMEAIMGDDGKLIDDIVSATRELEPEFIAVSGTPVPAMIGTDFTAIAEEIEAETGIPTFGFDTNGMNSYISGAGMAFEAIAGKLVRRDVKKRKNAINILGLTPLDFSINGSDVSIRALLEENGFDVVSSWAMGSSMEDISRAGEAETNLVVSQSGVACAKKLREIFGTPFVAGVPIGESFARELISCLHKAAKSGENAFPCRCEHDARADTVIIGESIFSTSLAHALKRECGIVSRIVCPLESEAEILPCGSVTPDDEGIIPCLKGAARIIADPLYRPEAVDEAQFISLPHEACSGRIYRRDIPNLIGNLQSLKIR